MRPLICTAVAVSALACGVAASAAPKHAAQPQTQAQAQTPAAAADRYAVATAYRTPTPGHGYPADARRRADCLASYPGYDWRSDRIHTRGGVTRPCPL
jgi:hypothetical protein